MSNNEFKYNPPKHKYLSILYADKYMIALDKPSGLLSVPGRPEEHKDSLALRVQQIYKKATVVHRLDMETSGIMIMPLNKKSHVNLSLQFEKKEMQKTYIARVFGVIKEDSGIIDKPMRCDWENRPKQIIDFEQGKNAITKWEVLEREENATRIKLTPITGRTHQLRVHMLDLGYPIIADGLYTTGKVREMSDRLQLHAENLIIKHPRFGHELKLHLPCPF